MNLFVVGWSCTAPIPDDEARRALDALLDRVPFFADDPRNTWHAPSRRATAAWVAHSPDRVGGVSYAATEPSRLALWSGRPILWSDDNSSADGRTPLDPRFYFQPTAKWETRLDGRCAVLRYDDHEQTLEVFCDPMGAYPLFAAEDGRVTWISNSAELLRDLSAADSLDLDVLASVLGGGWSLSGDPVWKGVRRLSRATMHSFGRDGYRRRPLLALPEIVAMLGQPLDVTAASETLVTNVAALADWPDRPNVVPTTAGRDSRLVLAAALAAGIDFHTVTGGAADDPDVLAGRLLSSMTGRHHEFLPSDPHGSVFTDWRRAAELVELQSSGTATLADATGFPHGPLPGPLPLWHSGQGGEIARGYYAQVRGHSHKTLIEALYRAFVGRRPGRREPLSEDGARRVRAQIAQFVEEALDAGAAARDVPDLFYLLRRMGTWAGPTHGCVEFVRDTTAPLWSARMLPHELAGSVRDRARESFHLRSLEELAPELVDIPLAGQPPWPAREHELARQARRALLLARKAQRQAHRRATPRLKRARMAVSTRLAAARRPANEVTQREVVEVQAGGLSPSSPADAAAVIVPAPAAIDHFASMHAGLRDLVRSGSEHPVWSLLDQQRVESLLTRDPSALDGMSRYYLWRLATVLAAPSMALEL